MKKFCITGVSGTGKSSVIEELKKKGINAFDIDAMDELCHWRDEEQGKRVEYYPGIGKEWLDKHYYFCDTKKLKAIMDSCDGPVVVAGLASNQEEFLALFDKVFLFYCDKKIFLQRLDNRENHDFARDKSEQEHILGYYKELEAEMREYGAVPIDTNAQINEIVNKIITEINSKNNL